ncbi:hypothetical protein N0V93_005776 [Gnomoniopsis smithogilvyi]|uniref:J domain-containing protein n=1 Tax=Gnomoniopsis smithogilvyi TaxID=1191159 RepID=A0A9W8YVC6_9PEZI|nr:hypothetical protein N0V93_005776 [Gnomoniopsis smithogilvyi]
MLQRRLHARSRPVGSQSADAAHYSLNPGQAYPSITPFPTTSTTYFAATYSARPKRMSLLANDQLYHSHYYKQRRTQENTGRQCHGHTAPKPNMTQPNGSAGFDHQKASSSTSTSTSSHYQDLDPDTAFRESVLDALSDADGAAYWQRVYGVDLSTIPRTKTDRITGATERTTDEERIAYARRMIFESQKGPRVKDQERRRRKMEETRRQAEESRGAEKERRERKERVRAAEAHRRMQEEIERSLRRGEERRKRTEMKSRFNEYSKQWTEWTGEQTTIPWPTLTGERKGITEKEIRSFLVRGLELKTVGAKEFLARLKEQRVRWHPDKMQQKMGGKDNVAKGVMEDITMIFQVVDTLYDDTRKLK